MSASIVDALLKRMLRVNTTDPSEAYFVDGASPPGSDHAAIHSTIYAALVGVADGNPFLASQLSAYLIRRDLGPSSCMTGKWVLEACYRLALFDPDGYAADYALHLLSRSTYPSWGYMIKIGATLSLEAWRPEDKWNTDWGHPWCASPAYAIPRLMLGAQPLEPGWTRFRIAPQPSTLAHITARLPTPLGTLGINYTAVADDGVVESAGGEVRLDVHVPSGTHGQVCLVLWTNIDVDRDNGGSSEKFMGYKKRKIARNDATSVIVLTVDGKEVAQEPWGRMTCTQTDIGAGAHSIVLALSQL